MGEGDIGHRHSEKLAQWLPAVAGADIDHQKIPFPAPKIFYNRIAVIFISVAEYIPLKLFRSKNIAVQTKDFTDMG